MTLIVMKITMIMITAIIKTTKASLVSVIGNRRVGHGAGDAGVGPHESEDVAAELAPNGSLVEGIDDKHGRLEHHDEVEEGEVHHEHVRGRPEAFSSVGVVVEGWA